MTKHMTIVGGRPLETKDEPGSYAELKTAFEAYHGTAKATAEKVTELAKELADERKEREALETKINRRGLGGGGTDIDANARNVELKTAIAQFARTDAFPTDLKTMSVGSDPAGGYMVDAQQSDGWVTKLWDMSPMRRVSRTINLTQGDAWEEPIDFDEAGAEWVGEMTSRTNTDTPDLGKLRIPHHELDAQAPLTQKLLDTANRDLGAWIENKIANKFARSEGAAFVTGNGVAKPKGFLSGTPVTTGDASRAVGVLQYIATGVSGDWAASAKGDKLIDLVYTLRAPYRKNAVWMMNSTTVGSVRKFKDSQNQYLWSDSLAEGERPRLLGYPVEVNEDMPDFGADTLPVAFGDFSLGYTIVQMPGIRMMRDPYTARPLVKFCAYQRVGGDIANSEAIKLLKAGTS